MKIDMFILFIIFLQSLACRFCILTHKLINKFLQSERKQCEVADKKRESENMKRQKN